MLELLGGYCPRLGSEVRNFPIRSNVSYFLVALLAVGGALTLPEMRTVFMLIAVSAFIVGSVSTMHHLNLDNAQLADMDVFFAGTLSVLLTGIFLYFLWQKRNSPGIDRYILIIVGIIAVLSAISAVDFITDKHQEKLGRDQACGQELYSVLHGAWHLQTGFAGILIVTVMMLIEGCARA